MLLLIYLQGRRDEEEDVLTLGRGEGEGRARRSQKGSRGVQRDGRDTTPQPLATKVTVGARQTPT